MTECDIQTVAFGGDGVAKVDGFVLFIPFTLPKERALVTITQKKSRFARASLKKILTPSPHRITPPCPYFTHCGGCQLQHSDYPYQLELKRQFVEDSLQRIGKISYPIPPVLASETLFGYRRHISLQLEYKDDKWQIGFSSINGNFLPIKSCLLFHSLGDPVLTLLQEALKELPSSPAGRIKILKAPSGYVLAFSFPYSLEEDSLSFFSTLAKNSLFIGICLQTPSQELSWKNPDLFYTYKDLTFSYSPFSFIQNHEEQSARIYEHVVNLLEPSSKILDLYCGIGITTLLLSKRNKQVLGIEINPVAISHAKENAKRNGLNPEIFICASADNATEEIASFAPDAILVNPPKTGLSPLVQKSLAFPSIKKIVYISCHPPTLARDCLTLTSQGFSLSHVQSFDMFPQTTHVETVVVFSRNT